MSGHFVFCLSVFLCLHVWLFHISLFCLCRFSVCFFFVFSNMQMHKYKMTKWLNLQMHNKHTNVRHDVTIRPLYINSNLYRFYSQAPHFQSNMEVNRYWQKVSNVTRYAARFEHPYEVSCSLVHQFCMVKSPSALFKDHSVSLKIVFLKIPATSFPE